MVVKKNKTMKNIRKSDPDVTRLCRGSSSGSQSTVSFNSCIAPSAHAILIDREMVKQVLVPKMKESKAAVLVSKKPGTVKKQASDNEVDFSKESRSSHVLKALSQTKVDAKKLEGSTTSVFQRDGMCKTKKQASTQSPSTPPPVCYHQACSNSPPPEEEEHEHIQAHDPDLAKYYEQGCWDQRSGNAALFHYPPSHHASSGKPRVSSPYVHSGAISVSAAYTRYRTYRGSSPYQKPKRSVAGLSKITNTAQRVASAKRMTIMDLKSKIKLLQDEIEKLRKENRFLNHLQHRQDNALKKWEGKDAELPRLLNQHKDEIRALQLQLRRAQQQYRDCSEKLSMREKKILRLENELDSLRALVHEEHLDDRHHLQEELNVTRMNLIGAEKRIREYMKHVDILEKNHRHQLAAQEKKMIKVNNSTYDMQQLVANLRVALRNKDRMLNYIQMRASGRNLVKAFQAEQPETEEMLCGGNMMGDLAQPFQPLDQQKQQTTSSELKPISTITPQGNGTQASRCEEVSFQEMDVSHISMMKDSTIGDANNNIIKIHESDAVAKIEKDVRLPKRPSSKQSRSLDSMMHQVPATTTIQQVGKKVVSKGKAVKAKKPPVKPSQISIKAHGSVQGRKENDKQQHRGPGLTSAMKSKPIFRDEINTATTASPTLQTTPKLSTPSLIKNTFRNQDNVKHEEKRIKSKKSKELVYQGSSTGFKYDGPFVKENEKKQSSTELLYSQTPEKINLMSSSSSASSSASTSQSASSSRSEILSNIDILSARIRESCVLVPPPEEALQSPTVPISVHQTISSDLYLDNDINKSNMGPGGDHPIAGIGINPYSQQQNSPVMSLSPRDGLQTSSRYQPQVTGGVLQLIAEGSSPIALGQTNVTSPRPTDSFLSSMSGQMQGISSVTNTTSPQYHLSQSSLITQTAKSIAVTTTNDLLQLTNSSAGTPTISARNQPITNSGLVHLQQNMDQYSDPRTSSQNFLSFNNFGYLTERSTNYQNGQQQGQTPIARFSSEYPYFSYAATSSPTTPSSPNVTIMPTNPIQLYDQQQINSSYSQPSSYFTPSSTSPKATTLPRVGYFSSTPNNVGGSEQQTLPSVVNTNPTQSSYNPSYYVNLGSWK